jgi:hypothetical protein
VEESTGPSMARDAPIESARVGCDVPEYFSRVREHDAGMMCSALIVSGSSCDWFRAVLVMQSVENRLRNNP